MSFFPAKDPGFGDARSSDAIAQVVVPRSIDLGGFQVRRALPSARSRMVGPFIFFDHFGPAVFKAGDGMDVRPHPHIGLSTVTYLFDGEIVHRDSLGSAVPIRPGAVNLMTAGRGIVHSERTAADHRDGGEPLHGLQLWVALPANRRGEGAGFRAYAFAEYPGAARKRPDAAGHRRHHAWPAFAGRDKLGDRVRTGAPHGRQRFCRLTPTMRNAPSM